MIWHMRHPDATVELLGFIPHFFSDGDPLPAREQIDQNYAHGGGWRSFKGFTMLDNGDLAYPGDPPCRLLAETVLHAGTVPEIIRFYEHSWIAIIQADGSYEIARID